MRCFGRWVIAEQHEVIIPFEFSDQAGNRDRHGAVAEPDFRAFHETTLSRGAAKRALNDRLQILRKERSQTGIPLAVPAQIRMNCAVRPQDVITLVDQQPPPIRFSVEHRLVTRAHPME
jgi:hypothetical protein